MSRRAKVAIATNALAWGLAWLNAELGTTTFALMVGRGCVRIDEHLVPVELCWLGAALVSVATIAVRATVPNRGSRDRRRRAS